MAGTEDATIGRAGMRPASHHLNVLDADECWARLRQHDLGRISFVSEGWPRIFPVNYAAGEGAIVFRTAPGAKLTYGPSARVCFEIDGVDVWSGSGWSVMAIGVLEDITDLSDDRGQRLRKLAVHPVAPGEKMHWLSLTPQELSGRSFKGGWFIPGAYVG